VQRILAFLLIAVFALEALGQTAAEREPLPETVQLQYPNVEIGVILDLYEKLTRKRLIRPNNILMGQLYIVINEELPREEAVKIIEMTLLSNGFTLVPTEDESIVKVFGLGSNPRTGNIPIVADPSQLPVGEQVVTYLFKLKNADPNEVGQIMTSFIAPAAGQYTTVTPLPKSQAVLVTESTPILRSLIRVVSEIDLPPAEVVSEFIPLERADAKDVLEKLEKIFEKQPSQSGTPGTTPRAPRTATLPDGSPAPAGVTAEAVGGNSIELVAGKLTEDSLIVGKIKLTADVRTNRIHVITRPVNIEFVRKLLKEFDRDVPFGEPAEYLLKFVTANDVLEAVIKAIQDPGAKDNGSSGDLSSNSKTNLSTTQPFNRGGSTGGFGGGIGGGAGGGFGGGGGFSEDLQTQEVNTTPKAVTVGNTRIIADPRSNKIIVLGNREVRDKIFKLLDTLDQRAPQVMIHVVIGQLDLTNEETFGFDYILRYGGRLNTTSTGNNNETTTSSLAGFGTPTNLLNVNKLLTQTAIKQIASAGAGGFSGFFTAGDTLNALVTALQKSNRFQVISRPAIFTSNNKKATIASGTKIPILSNSISSLTGNANDTAVANPSISGTTNYQTVALQLEVVPLINADGEVTLEILQKIDEVGENRKVAGNDVPEISTRFLKSTVSVPNEATLVLGGLIRKTEKKNQSGIPYLRQIPLLGKLFQSTQNEETRKELVILMRPVVTMNPQQSVRTRERELETFKIEPDLEGALTPKQSDVRLRAPKPAFRQPALPLLNEATSAVSGNKKNSR
jgi:general secretion pathway protein D